MSEQAVGTWHVEIDALISLKVSQTQCCPHKVPVWTCLKDRCYDKTRSGTKLAKSCLGLGLESPHSKRSYSNDFFFFFRGNLLYSVFREHNALAGVRRSKSSAATGGAFGAARHPGVPEPERPLCGTTVYPPWIWQEWLVLCQGSWTAHSWKVLWSCVYARQK